MSVFSKNTLVNTDGSSFFSGKLKPALLLGIIAVLVYINTLGNDFALDDYLVIKDNAFVNKGFAGIGDILTTAYHRGFNATSNDLYRPLTLVVFAIIRQLFGTEPFMYHAINLLAFAGCVIVFFLFLTRLFSRADHRISFIAALIFALHPIHTEVVANCKSLDELLCFLLAFGSLLAFDSYVRTYSISKLLVGGVCFFLSLMAKETSITFVVLLPFFLFLHSESDKSKKIIATLTALLAVAAMLAARYYVLHKGGSTEISFIDNALAGKDVTAGTRYATAFLILGSYLKLLFIPYPLVCDYAYNSIPFASFGDPVVLLSIAVYACMVAVAVYRLRRNSKDGYAFAIIFFLVTLSLFANVFFLVGAEMAERFQFFPSAGFCIVVGLLLHKIVMLRDRKSKIALPAICLLLTVYAIIIVRRNAEWKDNLTLFRADVERSPDDSRLNFLLGNELVNFGSTQGANADNRQALAEGITYFEKALTIYPGYIAAHVEAGRAYLNARQYDLAAQHEQAALALDPANISAISSLSTVYVNSGKYAQAISFLQPIMQQYPGNVSIHFNLGAAYANTGNYVGALAEYKNAIVIDPAASNYSSFDCVAELYRIMSKPDSAAIYRSMKAQYKK